MTEPNEPKIVHFSPRAQAPVQDTAGNWEPDEQLFGLEELLQQLPPIRKLHLEKGRLTDLMRLYPDMKREFAAPELLPQAVIATAMVRRRMELLLFRSDDQREAGYALVTVCSHLSDPLHLQWSQCQLIPADNPGLPNPLPWLHTDIPCIYTLPQLHKVL